MARRAVRPRRRRLGWVILRGLFWLLWFVVKLIVLATWWALSLPFRCLVLLLRSAGQQQDAEGELDAPAASYRSPWEPSVREAIPKGVRFDVFERDRWTCRYCGYGRADGKKLHIDHKLAVVRGGTNHPDNLLTACQDCNLGKGARLLLVDPAEPAAPIAFRSRYRRVG